MSKSIACSKVSGWSETGFAFGMRPPWAKRVARSSAGTSSEHASAVACSAFCDNITEDVGILPVVMTIRELGQVQRQIVLADFMERTHDATLQQAPEAIQVRRMDIAAHIFTLDVI